MMLHPTQELEPPANPERFKAVHQRGQLILGEAGQAEIKILLQQVR
jgi:hypothetical protein